MAVNNDVQKIICCKSCSSRIGTESSGKISVNDLKAVSAFEFFCGVFGIKCRTCQNWNMFSEGVQSINHQRKGRDVLYNANKK